MNNDADRAAVAAQLGRPPRGDWHVARRCACGLPQVIETHPHLDDGTPFPTMWWLTCRALSKALGRLEAGGWMADFNARLGADPALAAALEASTAAYVARRDGIPSPIPGPGGPSGRPGSGPLDKRGHPGGGGLPGGRIKCLHAHTGHHLISGDNPAGAQALAALHWVEPRTPCV